MNFKDFDDLLRTGIKEIVLDSDIILKDGEESSYPGGIALRGDGLVIDGNGHSIDAKGKTRIFTCSGNVTIRNLTLKNGFSGGSGGAVYNWDKLTLSHSTLQDNKSEKKGGAIGNRGSAIIEDCIINDNIAQEWGGAVYNEGSLKIVGSTLDRNFSTFGGAIGNSSIVVLNDCEFNSNKSVESGGAINSYDSYYDHVLGAVGKASVVCDGCNFSNNISKSSGGAVSTNFYIKFYRCSFHDNISKKGGNIIYFKGNEDISLVMENSFIESNSAIRSDIYISKSSSVSIKYTKIANRSDNYVIKNQRGILNISNIEFECTDKQSIYNNNVIWISDKNVEKFIKSSPNSVIKYKNQISTSDNGFQHLDDLINANSQSVVLDCDIIMDEAEQDYYEGGIELAHDNLILDGQNHVIDANKLSRIFIITGTDITLKNIKFKSGFYSKGEFDSFKQGGGAIYSLPNTSVNIENCEFVKNHSRNIAGCINNKGVMNIHESEFNDNSAQKSCGAIYNFNVLNLYGCNFKNNFAPLNEKYSEDKGYAETCGNIVNRGNMTFDDCNFIETKLFKLTMFLEDDELLFYPMAIGMFFFWGMFIFVFINLTSIALFCFFGFLIFCFVVPYVSSYIGKRFDYYE